MDHYDGLGGLILFLAQYVQPSQNLGVKGKDRSSAGFLAVMGSLQDKEQSF
jgi:hypothetical protein